MRYFTPGPTQLAPIVPALLEQALAKDICSISHRSKEFEAIFRRATEGIRTLLSLPPSHQVFFLASATEGWERIIQNCSGEHTFHVVNGVFAERFYTIAQELGRNAKAHTVPAGAAVDLPSITVPPESELICLTHNETSTGVAISEGAISALAKRYPDKLIAVDIVSSAPIVELPWQEVDCGFFSVQKCFGLPAGLGVLIVSDRALTRAVSLQNQNVSVGSYHSFPALLAMAKKHQTPETPNVLGIYLLAGVAEEFLRTGIDVIRTEIRQRAKMLYQFFESRPGMTPFVKELNARSSTVLTIEVTGGSAPLLKALAAKGFEVGAGYGSFKDAQIRVANFPLHTPEQIAALCAALR
ncbi:MAG: alanine--glyoxylate aminotransferase family protein [Proteobacteria bacterium]|nr:alanine--glyoxylate aminotransferase family protein [Pseudomonadota bacterium]